MFAWLLDLFFFPLLPHWVFLLFLPLTSLLSSRCCLYFFLLLFLLFFVPLSFPNLTLSSFFSFSFFLPILSIASSLLPPCSVRDKFVEVDLKPVCKNCYERLPDDMKRRLAKRERDSKDKKKKSPIIPMCL